MERTSRANRRGAKKRGEEDQRVEVLSGLIRMFVEVGTVGFLRAARHTFIDFLRVCMLMGRTGATRSTR